MCIERFEITLIFTLINYVTFGQVADFFVPDTVCVNQNIAIQNLSTGGNTYFWSFCNADLMSAPAGVNLGNIGFLNSPVYSKVVKNGNDFYLFISNLGDGSITRLFFGNSLLNTPIATNLGNLGVLGYYIEGIDIQFDDFTGKWIGLVSWGQVDHLVRLDFGNSLNNIPLAEDLGNIGGLMNFAHTIFAFSDKGKWYCFIDDYGSNSIIRMDFGNSLTNSPVAVNIGNVGGLDGPVGLYPIRDNGEWYMFVVNRNSNSVSRLDFGNSLVNNPIGTNLANQNGNLNFPRSITIIRDCGQVYGFVVNESTNDLVRLTFPNGLISSPSAKSLGNVGSLSFPHHISELFRDGDNLYGFILNVNDNSISRVAFSGCSNASIPSSNLQNPPAFSYNLPGKYKIKLILNEGQPTENEMCKEVVAIANPKADFSGDTLVCIGGTIHFKADSPGCIYSWSGPNHFLSTDQDVTIPKVEFQNAGLYSLNISKTGCSSSVLSKEVSIFQNSYYPDIIGDTNLCVGENIKLTTATNAISAFQWKGPDGFTSTNNDIEIDKINVNNSGIYSLWVTVNGCTSLEANKTVTVLPVPIVNLGMDTIICNGQGILLDAANIGSRYQWNTGDTTEFLHVFSPGKYEVTVSNLNCASTDEIIVDDCNAFLWLPNVFTPNQDGINEHFRPVILATLNTFEMLIFNRWGQQIYKTTDYLEGWDGTFSGEPCPTGVYYYVVTYSSGLTSASYQQKVNRGSVTLLR